eukprot:g10515.t1
MPLRVRIELPGSGSPLLEFSTPGDVDPLTPLSSVVAGLERQARERVDEESSASETDTHKHTYTHTGVETTTPPLTLSLCTSDMLHDIPLSTPVGMLMSLVSPSHIGPLVLSASFTPTPHSPDTAPL